MHERLSNDSSRDIQLVVVYQFSTNTPMKYKSMSSSKNTRSQQNQCVTVPSKHETLINVVLKLGRRLRRQPNIKTTLGQGLVIVCLLLLYRLQLVRYL